MMSGKTLIIGLKNTGKSYLCEYVLNLARKNNGALCIIDTDLGKNRLIPGSLSLTILKNKELITHSLWVGELTPLNNLEGYMKALKALFAIYKERYFTCPLLINTMGYLTGIGEILLY